ncbi:MAG: GFA family protein [Colwellia sp.]|nr:GFA family protein [Colwellia sp.]
MDYPINGACQCGQLTYKLHKKPIMVLACHCTECQKLSTSPFSITAIVEASAIEFSGKMNKWSRVADSGNKNNAMFCPTCGNRIYHYNPDDKETIKLKLKPVSLTDDRIFIPSAHVWVCEKLSWYKLPDDVQVFDKQP